MSKDHNGIIFRIPYMVVSNEHTLEWMSDRLLIPPVGIEVAAYLLVSAIHETIYHVKSVIGNDYFVDYRDLVIKEEDINNEDLAGVLLREV